MKQNTFRGFDSNCLSLLKPHQQRASKDFQNLFSDIKECYKINIKITSNQNDQNFGQSSVSLINKQSYEKLLINIFEVTKIQATFQVAISFIYSFIQQMDLVNCNMKTKYLAKIYIDFYLRSEQQQSENTFNILAFTAMNLAIKFNESFVYPLEVFLQKQDGKYSIQELVNFEIKLLKVLKFKLNYVTPFTYLDILKDNCPQKQNFQIYNDIEVFIQLCALDIRLIGCQCVHIFLGCLAAFVEENLQQSLHHLLSEVLCFSSVIPYICQVVKQQINESDLLINEESTQTNDISI